MFLSLYVNEILKVYCSFIYVIYVFLQVQQTAQTIKSYIEAGETPSVTSPMTSASNGRANQDKAAMVWSRAECELNRRD